MDSPTDELMKAIVKHIVSTPMTTERRLVMIKIARHIQGIAKAIDELLLLEEQLSNTH